MEINELKHHGVKGMKWGRRNQSNRGYREKTGSNYKKYRNNTNHSFKKPKVDGAFRRFKNKHKKFGFNRREDRIDRSREQEEREKIVREEFKKITSKTKSNYRRAKTEVRDLSDNDLAKRIDRLRKEKEYLELLKPEKSKTRKVFDAVSPVVKKSAEKIAVNTLSKYGTAKVGDILKSRGVTGFGGSEPNSGVYRRNDSFKRTKEMSLKDLDEKYRKQTKIAKKISKTAKEFKRGIGSRRR